VSDPYPDQTHNAGDREARFDVLYTAHHQTLHAYFLGRTADAELALDLLQDCFLRAWRNLASVQDLSDERQRAWLFSVARNLVIDQHRRRATRKAVGDALAREASVADSTSAGAESQAEERERRRALDLAIRRLPEELRTVLVLQVVGERNSTEIGELLERPPGTVRYQLAEARRRLAQDLRLMEVRSA
jgi:RNA polymerase sigma-70 factor (ECF subfamily)